jgi:hypothetical protein
MADIEGQTPEGNTKAKTQETNGNTGLDKAKKIADIVGAILLPVVLLVVGQWFTAQQAKSESQRTAGTDF